MPSVCELALQSSLLVGLSSKPSLLKNSIERFRSRTGMLTKISREGFCAKIGLSSRLRGPKHRSRSRRFRPSALLLTIEHPLNAEGVRQHPKGRVPERVLQGHGDLAARGERIELFSHFCGVAEI